MSNPTDTEKQKRPRGNPNLKPKWIHQQTKTMRVPTIFHDVLKEIAEKLDHGIYTPDGLRDLIAEDIEKMKTSIAKNMKENN